jgi:hypothetical protein
MKRFFSLSVVGLLSVTFTVAAVAPQINRLVLEKEIESLYKQIKEKEQTFVEPSAQNIAQFAQFLSQPDTGIFRILPRNKYDGKLLTVPGNGAYYSFSRRSNTFGYGSDIEYSQGKFRTGFSSSAVGFFSQLGDISIESITLEHPAAAFLNKYTPPAKESEIRQHQQQQANYNKGIREGEFTFSSQVALFSNTTYLLRSIDYYASSDILVALRVVKQDGDGSLVIIWKKLKLFPTPLVER